MIFWYSWIVAFVLACANSIEATGSWGFRKKSYTPLLFFTVPKGMIPECDTMERAVRSLEQQVGVRIERLDLLRNPESEAILGLLTKKTPPFLYHRESGQIMHIPTGGGPIDMDRLRAWAKGRMVSSSARLGVSGIASRAPNSARQQQKQQEEEEEMIENMSLTPTQLEGKLKMKERTKKQSK